MSTSTAAPGSELATNVLGSTKINSKRKAEAPKGTQDADAKRHDGDGASESSASTGASSATAPLMASASACSASASSSVPSVKHCKAMRDYLRERRRDMDQGIVVTNEVRRSFEEEHMPVLLSEHMFKALGRPEATRMHSKAFAGYHLLVDLPKEGRVWHAVFGGVTAGTSFEHERCAWWQGDGGEEEEDEDDDDEKDDYDAAVTDDASGSVTVTLNANGWIYKIVLGSKTLKAHGTRLFVVIHKENEACNLF